jgi:hypothetical protein
MIIFKKSLSRRSFLKGAAGTAVALPFLDAMTPALFGQSKARPFRFGAIYIPNGIFTTDKPYHQQQWVPEKIGADFEFKQVMLPLEPFRNYLTVVSKMRAPAGNPENGGVHMGASAAFLNGVGPLTKQANYTVIQSKKTIDQFIADKIAEDTPLSSLQVGTEDMGTSAGACDGYPCVFFNTISWRDDTSPLPMGINPRVTFERMFGEAGSAKRRLTNLATKQSLLDSIAAETAKLQKQLGPADNVILEEYLTNVRHVEKQLERMETRIGAVPEGTDAPRGIPDTFDEHMTITYDLMRLAFQGDISRVFTFMVGHEGSSRSYAHVGVPEPHHPVTHADSAEKVEKYNKVTTYHSVKLAEFLTKLQATPDGDGNLLDRSLIYYGSGMGNGNEHDRNNPPAAVFGGANGRHKGNMHIAVQNNEPTANLLLSFADMANADLEQLGKSSGRMII